MFKDNSSGPVIFTPEFNKCWDEITKMHDEQRTHSEPKNIAVLGVSGVGKSSLIRAYTARYSVEKQGSHGHKPVVSFRVPSAPTAKSLMQSVNRAFRGPDTGSSAELMRRAVQYINHFRCEILFVDETNHLIDRGRMKTHAHLGDCWKEFSDQVGCSIVLVGQPRVRLLFDTNNQLRNRVSATYALRPFAYSDEFKPLAQFVRTLVNGTSLDDAHTSLLQADSLNRIQYASDGVPALVVKFLHRLRQIRPSSAEVNNMLMDQAWCLPGTGVLPPHRRPFCKEFNFERLMGVDEPFYACAFDGDNHAFFG